MGIQAAPVFVLSGGGGSGGGGSTGFTWPDISLSGNYIKRHIAQYGQNWYAEYWIGDATTGVTFTVSTAVTADFFMVSPGFAGTNGATTSGGAGGGAGAPFTWTGVALAAREYNIIISTARSSVEGGAVSLIATTPTGGVAAGTPYRLYDDATQEYGAAGSKGAGGSIVPGQGASGCRYLPVRAPSTAYGVSASNGGTLIGALGVGAGGNGGAAMNYLGGNAPNMAAPGAGTVGMVMFRVLLPV